MGVEGERFLELSECGVWDESSVKPVIKRKGEVYHEEGYLLYSDRNFTE